MTLEHKRVEGLPVELRQQILENLALPTDINLLLPGLLGLALTNGPIDKPAHFAGLKLPGRATFLTFSGTFFDDPAGFVSLSLCKTGQQEIKLPFNVGRNISPALFIAVHSLYRGTK